MTADEIRASYRKYRGDVETPFDGMNIDEYETWLRCETAAQLAELNQQLRKLLERSK